MRDVVQGFRVVGQNAVSTWWEWTNGSSLIFWRWSSLEQRRAARDGMPVFVADTLPNCRQVGTSQNIDPGLKSAVAEKLEKVIRNRYLAIGPVSHLVHYFPVPKGEDDIRLVYDGTKGGLNAVLWAPSFFLPDFSTSLMFLSFNSWVVDSDFGDMFLNFPLDERLQPYAGISLQPFESEMLAAMPGLRGPDGRVPRMHWDRLFMGLKPSPCISVRHYYWGEEFVRGDPSLEDNPFAFDRVILNLPGTRDYDPRHAKVLKWDSRKNRLAGDLITYIDDSRGAGSSAEHAWQVRRRHASRMQYLGMQDAPRKAEAPTHGQPRDWIGGSLRITPDGIWVSIPDQKWMKLRSFLAEIHQWLIADPKGRPLLDHKKLERFTGFIIHIAMTLDDFKPFTKGLYLTMHSWRPGCQSSWEPADSECAVEEMEEKWSNSLLASVDPRTDDWKDSLPSPPEIKPPKRV